MSFILFICNKHIIFKIILFILFFCSIFNLALILNYLAYFYLQKSLGDELIQYLQNNPARLLNLEVSAFSKLYNKIFNHFLDNLDLGSYALNREFLDIEEFNKSECPNLYLFNIINVILLINFCVFLYHFQSIFGSILIEDIYFFVLINAFLFLSSLGFYLLFSYMKYNLYGKLYDFQLFLIEKISKLY